MILSLICFALAVACYGISQLIMHGKSRFRGEFWDISAWQKKYKRIKVPLSRDNYLGWGFVDAPDNWYYKLINVRYIERWPTSTSLTVFLTDGLVYLGTWYLVFNVTYKVLSK